MFQLDNESDTSDIKVLVSVPPLCPPEDYRRLAEVFFEDTGIGGLYLANKSVLAMYGGGRTTGICVDTGEDMTYIVPCWEGTPLPNATMIQKLGGKHVTDRLMALLSNGKYSFPDDTFLLLRGNLHYNATLMCFSSSHYHAFKFVMLDFTLPQMGFFFCKTTDKLRRHVSAIIAS